MTTMRTLFRWLFPGGVVAALAMAVLFMAPAGREDLAATIAARYGPIAYVVAAGLAVAFHRSRVLALVVALAVFEAAARTGMVAPSDGPALGVAMAALLGLGAVARDRGVTSMVGVGHVVGASGFAAVWAAGLSRGIPALTAFALAPSDPPDAFPWLVASPQVLVFVAVGVLLAVAAAYRRRGPVERAALWSLGLVVGSALPGAEGSTASLLRMAAALTLGLAVLETSYAMAYRDELTGLPGRRSLMRDLDGLGGTYTLAMVDVDHFKKFNDKHGHDVGDQVLRLVASRLAKAPAGGRAYRYGGEEFTILYRGLERQEAMPYLESVRASVASARFSLRRWNRPARTEAGKAKRGGGAKKAARSDRTLSVTVSVGAADSKAAAAATPEGVLQKADKALYRAKRGGRDRVSA
ncbi:MAG: GGDEF domain-containing protein [Gemmatimonadota bacterium]